MHCASCETLIKGELQELAGLSDISVSSKEGRATMAADLDVVSTDEILEAVQRAGYAAEVISKKSRKFYKVSPRAAQDTIKVKFTTEIEVPGGQGNRRLSSTVGQDNGYPKNSEPRPADNRRS